MRLGLAARQPGLLARRGLLSAAGGKSVPQDEVDEIEVYGSEAQSGTQLATYSFEVRLGTGRGLPRQPDCLPEHCCVCRYVTASSTSDPVPTLPWASLLSSLKRCFWVKRWGARGSRSSGALSSL